VSSSLSNAGVFGVLLLFSILLVVAYYRGGKKNLRILKASADMLEETLRPADKTYTWLGGTIGFRAEYRVSGFEKVEALVTVLPRQSLLYMPFALLRGSRDRLEIIFFLQNSVDSELHIIKQSELRQAPALKQRSLMEVDVSVPEGYSILASRPDSATLKGMLRKKDSFFTPHLCHLALVPERKTLFMSFSLPTSNPTVVSKNIKALMRQVRAR